MMIPWAHQSWQPVGSAITTTRYKSFSILNDIHKNKHWENCVPRFEFWKNYNLTLDKDWALDTTQPGQGASDTDPCQTREASLLRVLILGSAWITKESGHVWEFGTGHWEEDSAGELGDLVTWPMLSDDRMTQHRITLSHKLRQREIRDTVEGKKNKHVLFLGSSIIFVKYLFKGMPSKWLKRVSWSFTGFPKSQLMS